MISLIERLAAFFGKTPAGNNHVPKKTMIFVVDPKECWWHLGQSGKKPITQILCHFEVINITPDLEVLPIVAMLNKSKTYGHVSIKEWKSGSWGSYMIPAKAITEANIDFWVPDIICKDEKVFKSSITIFDQFNNKHVINDVIFRHKKR